MSDTVRAPLIQQAESVSEARLQARYPSCAEVRKLIAQSRFSTETRDKSAMPKRLRICGRTLNATHWTSLLTGRINVGNRQRTRSPDHRYQITRSPDHQITRSSDRQIARSSVKWLASIGRAKPTRCLCVPIRPSGVPAGPGPFQSFCGVCVLRRPRHFSRRIIRSSGPTSTATGLPMSRSTTPPATPARGTLSEVRLTTPPSAPCGSARPPMCPPLATTTRTITRISQRT